MSQVMGAGGGGGGNLPDPVTVPHGGTGLTTITAHSLIVGEGTSNVTPLGAATNGQLPIGSTGADPVLAAITAGTNITVTNGAGSITIAATGGLPNDPLHVANGGTGLSTITAHSLVVGEGTSNMVALGAATNGQIPIGSTGADPVLASITAGTNITVTPGAGSITIAATGGLPNDPLHVANGGTGLSTITAHSLIVGEGTSNVVALGSATNGQLPIGSTGADPVLAALSGTANQLTVTNGAGSITLSLPSAITAPGSLTTTTTLTSTTLFTASAGQVVAVNNQTGTSYTVLVTDFVVSFNNAAAVAVTLPTSPTTGQMFRLKDASGAASLQNITITPAAGNIDGSATYVINNNYGSVDLVYSGTKWFVL